MTNLEVDVVVVGGSYGGLSAALHLARTHRKIAVFDAGQPRNRTAEASHGFLGQDGRPPAEISADGKAQLLAYPNVTWIDELVTSATGEKDDFTVVSATHRVHARRLVLATGIVDELPQIEGVAERWGRGVFHCPYCDGYELAQGRIGVLATDPRAIHQAILLPDWGPTTLFLNDAFEPDDEQHEKLQARGVHIERGKVVRLTDRATVELADGSRFVLAGIFAAPSCRMASPLAEELGCDFEDGPAGPYLRRNEEQETTVSGVYACGDAGRPFGNVAIVVGDGARAGLSAHKSLVPGL